MIRMTKPTFAHKDFPRLCTRDGAKRSSVMTLARSLSPVKAQFEKACLRHHLNGQQEIALICASAALPMVFSFTFAIVSALQSHPSSTAMGIALGSSLLSLASLGLHSNQNKLKQICDTLGENLPASERLSWTMPENIEKLTFQARLKGVALAGAFTALSALPISGLAAGMTGSIKNATLRRNARPSVTSIVMRALVKTIGPATTIGPLSFKP